MKVNFSPYYAEKRRQHYILTHCYKADKKSRSKAFYVGTDNAYSQDKGDKAYARTVEFKKEWKNA